MRQIFTSPRLENVEGVARLLNEHGIETHISSPRSYKGNRRGNFSYTALARGQGGPQAAVWIVRAEDQTRARQILREANLMESDRPTYLPGAYLQPEQPAIRPRANTALRIRLFLLGIIGAMAAAMFFRMLAG